MRDAQILDFPLALTNCVKFVQQSVNQLTGFSLDIRLDVEHGERLLDVFLAENVWELGVHLHVEEDIFAVQHLRDRRSRVRICQHLVLEYPLEDLIELDGTLSIKQLHAVLNLFTANWGRERSSCLLLHCLLLRELMLPSCVSLIYYLLGLLLVLGCQKCLSLSNLFLSQFLLRSRLSFDHSLSHLALIYTVLWDSGCFLQHGSLVVNSNRLMIESWSCYDCLLTTFRCLLLLVLLLLSSHCCRVMMIGNDHATSAYYYSTLLLLL